MKAFLLISLMLVAHVALAGMVEPQPVFDWSAIISALFGEKGDLAVTWMLAILVIWAQVRQLIPASWLAKLPDWLIDFLEFLASNKGKAANETWNDPKHLKEINKQ